MNKPHFQFSCSYFLNLISLLKLSSPFPPLSLLHFLRKIFLISSSSSLLPPSPSSFSHSLLLQHAFPMLVEIPRRNSLSSRTVC